MPDVFSKFALCCWNYWGDDIVDRPDNVDEIIVSELVSHALKIDKSSLVVNYQHIDDPEAKFKLDRHKMFRSHKSDIRSWAYDRCVHAIPVDYKPDTIFCRWRWDVGVKNDQRLLKQKSMLDEFLGTSTHILIWDEDYQITQKERDELLAFDNVTFIETSERALNGECDRTIYVPHPITLNKEEALAKVLGPAGLGNGDHLEEHMHLSYVGNNYERYEYINKYLRYHAARRPGSVHLYGNWLKYNKDILDDHLGIVFHTKASKEMLHWVYQHSYCVPMLAKKVYFDVGHITPRLYEVVSSGTIPIGFHEFRNVERYILKENVVRDCAELNERVDYIRSLNIEQRRNMLSKQIDVLLKNRVFDTNYFFDCITNEQ